MNRRLLEEIYLKNRQGLFTLALSIARCPASAEDAVHDAFVRLCGREEVAVADPDAYVFQTVRNVALDHYRRRQSAQRNRTSIFEAASVASPAAPDPECAEQVQRALDKLPDEQREVIVLKCFSSLTFEQIAQVADAPLATVASRYRRGLVNLRRDLEVLMT